MYPGKQFFILVLILAYWQIISFVQAGIGYKKFLKGLILGALLSGKTHFGSGGEEQHHYFYPVYHSMPI